MSPFLDILLPLSSIALFGFSGSLHCVGMCSPLVATCLQRSWKYFLARCLSYTIIGTIAGFLGLIFFKNFFNFSALSLAWIVVSICLFQIIFIILNFKKVSSHSFNKILFYVKNYSPFSYPTTMGIITAILPCGFLYAALIMSATFTNPFYGGLGMFIFSLVTSPALLTSKVFFNIVFMKNPKMVKIITIILLILTILFALKRGGLFNGKSLENPTTCHGKY